MLPENSMTSKQRRIQYIREGVTVLTSHPLSVSLALNNLLGLVNIEPAIRHSKGKHNTYELYRGWQLQLKCNRKNG